MLTCGIIGLPLVGKTTLFNLLTNSEAETSRFQTGRTEANVGMTWVPDKRIDWLSNLFNPKKTTYAQIEVTDVVGVSKSGAIKGGNPFLASVRDCDALIHVIRAFENKEVLHPNGGINPLRDFNDVWAELFLADLDAVEKRIAKIEASKKRTKEMDLEYAALGKCREALEAEKPIHTVVFTEDEKAVLKSFTFLTERPMLVVLNVDENQLADRDAFASSDLGRQLEGMNIPLIVMSVQVEREIAGLEESDREVFMADLGITEPGIEVLTRATYAKLGLVSFFTMGEDEVRAWTITRGTEAKAAAGKIHSDIERGFIRAEVVAFDVLQEYGTVAKAREKGLFRLEGKDYVVKDGDIINFRFNA